MIRAGQANQDRFLNDGGLSTAEQVTAALDRLAVAGQILPKGTVTSGLSNRTLNFATRISWKYAVSRGVSGTPGFLLNGVPIITEDVDGGAWNLTQWKDFIDPVLKPLESPPPPKTTAVASCAVCEGAGAGACCATGEFCIPGVGCRVG